MPPVGVPKTGIPREILWDIAEYKPHSIGQREYHASKARFKVAAAGRRYGKTKMSIMDKVDRVFTLRPGRWWIVAEEYSVGEEDFIYLEQLLDSIRNVFGVRPKAHAHNVKQGELFFEMPWGYRVEVKSARYPNTLVSKGLDCATLSEAAKLDEIVWDKYIRPALADRRAPGDMASTPEGDNWFKDRCEDGAPGGVPGWYLELPEWARKHYTFSGTFGAKRLERGVPWEDSWESWNLPSWENPIVYPGGFYDPEIQAQLKTREGTAFFWQEIGASFKALTGAVYPQFARSTHVRPHAYNPEWSNYAAWDFGFANPTAVLDIQIDPQGNWYVWREYYQPKDSIFGHIAFMKGRENPIGYQVACGFADAADQMAIEEIGKNLYPCYADPRSKDFEKGVQEVQGLLEDVQGTPRLFVDPSCVNFIREIGGYKWPKVKNEPTKAVEKPINQPNHLLDALRYAVMHLKVLGGAYHIADILDAATLATMRGRREEDYAGMRREEDDGEPQTIFSLRRATVF